MADDQKIFYVLIGIEGLNTNNPLVIGIFEDRDDAYEERDRLQKDDFSTNYYIRAGVRIPKGLYETDQPD